MPKDSAVESTGNVLDMMTASITGRKSDAAKRLTPVGQEVEKAHVLPRTQAVFPNDVPTEAVVQAVAAIRREVGYILAALDAVDEQLGKAADSGPVDLDAVRREREREADERVAAAERITTPETEAIKERLSALSKKAQEATFTEGGWVCPTHGKATTKTTSRGREFRGCPDCDEFERL